MDERIEAFLADVLALEGESPEAIRETVRAALADCEAVFRTQEAKAHERQGGARVPFVMPHARSRSNEATPGNANGAALTVRA
jgi:hypothetical protein